MLLREISYRQLQALNLYIPLPVQKKFHQCLSPERIIIGGNRGAKTMACAAEVAMAATGKHPYLPYPKENGRIVCVAKDGVKIGTVMYRKLFVPGAFRMVKDENGMYRCWKPWEDGWKVRTYPSLPLIPRRLVKSISWEDKSLQQPKLILLHNGWEILFATSAGKPIEGIDVDLVWFDEEIYDARSGAGWYDEMAARLIDRNGRFIWSATPQGATEQLDTLQRRAQEERNAKIPKISEFHCTMNDNPYLPEEAKELFRHKASFDEDEYRVRVLGLPLITSHLVYPEFRTQVHACKPFEIPADWCRYLVLDPGFANIACLLFAVPPPNDPRHKHVYLYDEIYARRCDARTFAEMLYTHVSCQSFQAFIIDKHGSKRTEVSGKDIGESFAEEFARKGIRSIETKSDFLRISHESYLGTDIVRDGCMQVRSWLWKRPEHGATPKLQVFEHCENFLDEMSRYKNKVVKGKVTDKPDGSRHSHGPDALRYGVVHGLEYVAPRKNPRAETGIYRYWLSKMKRKKPQTVNLGPGE